MEKDEYQDLLVRYKERVQAEFGEAATKPPQVSSKEYSEFKREIYPAHYTWFEKACNWSEKTLKLTADSKKSAKQQRNLNAIHLNATPSGVLSFSILAGLAVIVFGSLFLFAVPVLLGLPPMTFLVVFSVISGLALIPALQRYPTFLANKWRIKASNQMIQSIFYLVTYMRHTSNLERAIAFSADHLDAPLSLDFRKILWDVETQKYSTIRDSANAYLTFWKDWNNEFVESFHLVESSLFEGSEDRRLALLDKSLEVILNGTYENMLHYAHNLKSPLTILHMLGVILPILGLVILPLVVSFLGSGSNPFTTAIYISVLYNITLPVLVFYIGQNVLSKRPAGYGASDISKKSGMKHFANVNIPVGKKLNISVNPFYIALMVFVVTFIMGLSPLILHALDPTFEISTSEETFKLQDYVCPPETPNCEAKDQVGPYGIGSSLLSLVLIGGIGLSVGLYYRLRSSNVIKVRERTKALEDEFSSALFQLGNRLGDGIPAEIAFARVGATMQNTTSGDFFNVAERNITKLGMGLEQSIFDPKVGALVTFPSKVIESSMKVLTESIKKGPLIAAQALLSMANYIKEIHRVEERLKDLMADIISSMKAQVKFLTPAIAGIVIGITSMISTILTKLSGQLQTFAAGGQDVGGFGDLLNIFGIGIPTYFFQIVVGLYVVQIAYILTTLASGIENGSDKLGERFALGKNLVNSTLLYCFIAGIVMLLFNLFASQIISKSLV
jgi:hypothetical protein